MRASARAILASPMDRLGVPRPRDAPEFIRALFAAGATPGKVRVSVLEAFSPPRVAAMAERRPRYGAVPAGALDLPPGPGG
eukprot:4895650-Alexandrium_andersonii.AAC.1